MSKNKEPFPAHSKSNEKPERWCQYIVAACYAVVAINALSHILWALFAKELIVGSVCAYWEDYIILPSIYMLAINSIADLLVRSRSLPMLAKKYISLMVLLIFCFYLCLIHNYTSVLLGTYVMPVLASTMFSNIKITRRIFLISNIALILSGLKMYYSNALDSGIIMEVFVAWAILLCSHLLAKVLLRYGQDNIMSLKNAYYDQKSMQEQLKLESFTGLYNRKTFDEYLPKLMEECKNLNTCLSLAILDMDCFKEVNDVYGHIAGDRVLLRLAHILKSNKTENIYPFRIGGEEFAVLLKGYCVKDAYKVCEGMRSIMESSPALDMDKKRVTFSGGIACMNKMQIDPIDFFNAADTALYKAKNNGRNNIAIYDGDVQCIHEHEHEHG